jgi:hypothetical protein
MREQPAGVLADAGGVGLAVVLAGEDAARPQHVVADEEPARPQALVGEVHGLGIARLVDVVVDDVPRPAHAAERGRRFLLVIGDAVPHAGAAQEAARQLDVLGGQLGAVDGATLAHRPREVERGVTVAGAELEHAARADGAREDDQRAAHQRAHDREPLDLRELLHLVAHRVVVVVEAAQVLFNVLIDDGWHARPVHHKRAVSDNGSTSRGLRGRRASSSRRA